MDGYAVRAEDLHEVPVRLPVTDDIAAGHPPARGLEAGTAIADHDRPRSSPRE